MDWKIELIYVPVTDVDRAKEFYERIGFHADHDQTPFDGLRFVQMTPPGSACSIAFGTGLGNDLEPGRQNTIQVVVPDAAHALHWERPRAFVDAVAAFHARLLLHA